MIWWLPWIISEDAISGHFEWLWLVAVALLATLHSLGTLQSANIELRTTSSFVDWSFVWQISVFHFVFITCMCVPFFFVLFLKGNKSIWVLFFCGELVRETAQNLNKVWGSNVKKLELVMAFRDSVSHLLNKFHLLLPVLTLQETSFSVMFLIWPQTEMLNHCKLFLEQKTTVFVKHCQPKKTWVMCCGDFSNQQGNTTLL